MYMYNVLCRAEHYAYEYGTQYSVKIAMHHSFAHFVFKFDVYKMSMEMSPRGWPWVQRARVTVLSPNKDASHDRVHVHRSLRPIN